MNIMNKTVAGVLLAVVQIGMVGSLVAKLMMDRARYPHVWVKTTSYDPNLFIRGRYVALNFQIPMESIEAGNRLSRAPEVYSGWNMIRLEVRNDELVAVPDPNGKLFASKVSHQVKLDKPKENCPQYNQYTCTFETVNDVDDKGRQLVTYHERSLYFIPETSADPTVRGKGEELWVDATITPKGLPRPIRLGVKKDGKITPLDIP